MYGVLYIPGGAGFQPSTVSPWNRRKICQTNKKWHPPISFPAQEIKVAFFRYNALAGKSTMHESM